MTEVAEACALSEAQQGIWLGQQLAPDSPMYNAAEAVHMHGELDVDLFRQALDQVMSEATALHMVFRRHGESALQLPSLRRSGLEYHDLREQNNAENIADDMMNASLAQAVDLEQGPLYRQQLFRISDRYHIWYQQIHHIAADGYAFNLLRQRIFDLYNRLQRAPEVAAPRALLSGKPFADFYAVINEDQRYRQSPRYQEDRLYWLSQFGDAPTAISFKKGNTSISDRAIHRSFAISAQQFSRMKQVCKGIHCNWSAFFIGLVALLLYRQRAVQKMVLGIPVMCRMGSASLRVPSMIMNIAPLQIDLNGLNSFRDLVLHIAEQFQSLAPHQRFRYEQLRRDLQQVGGDRRLFGPVVNIMPFDQPLRLNNIVCRMETRSAGPVDDISFNVVVTAEQGVRFDLDANPLRYSDEDLASLEHACSNLFQELLGNVYLPLTLDIEHFSCVQGAPLAEPPVSVIELFTRQVQDEPEAIALVHGGRRLSYAQLYENSQRLARQMLVSGLGMGERVGLHLQRGEAAVTASLACLMSGIPFLFIDPDGPARRNRYICENAALSLVLYQDQVPQFNVLPARSLSLLELCAQDVTDKQTLPVPEQSAVAYLIYTSGSTGQPKGIEVDQRALAEFVIAAAQEYGVHSSDRMLQFAPLHFDACIEEFFVSLCSGATLIVRAEDMLDSFAHFLRQCEQLDISVLDLPTAYWHELVFYCSNTHSCLPASVQCVIIGGEAVQKERVRQWLQINRYQARLLNTYGPSEATVVASYAEVSDAEDMSIGFPLPGRLALVVDEEQHIVPRGSAGELVLAGAGLARGYLGQEAPVTGGFGSRYFNVLDKTLRIYRTGDRARLDERGRLHYLGRIDDEIKISGHRINPLEIEAAMLRLPELEQAALIIVDERGNKQLIACLVSNQAMDVRALRERLADQLPAAMLPSRVVQLEQLPKNAAGKVDRRALQAHCEHGDRTVDRSEELTELQARIIDIWQQVLGAQPMVADDDFFLLGGQSLQSIQVINRLSVELQRDIPVSLLFQYPTVRELAQQLEQCSPAGAERERRRQIEEDCCLQLPVGRAQHVLVHQQEPECILLTGASGFLGTQLLYQLLQQTRARIVCLLRPDANGAVQDKLACSMQAQGLDFRDYAERIEMLAGDLEQPRLGLTETQWRQLEQRVDTVWHNAAITSVVRGYASLRAGNLLATRALIELAAVRRIPFHYVSTIAVADAQQNSLQEDFVAWHGSLLDGYQQTKWAAEKILQSALEQGCPVSIYRLGRISGHSEQGYLNRQDLVWRIVQSAVRLGIWPDMNVQEPWTPVDWTADIMVRLALSSSEQVVFNITPPAAVSLRQVFDRVVQRGYRLQKVSLEQWTNALQASHDAADQALAVFFSQMREQHVDSVVKSVDNHGICAFISRHELAFSVIDHDMLDRYIDYAIQQAWLSRPQQPSANEVHYGRR